MALFGSGRVPGLDAISNPDLLRAQPQMGSMGSITNGQLPTAMPQPGFGTRTFGQGWEDKAFALGGLLQGDGGAGIARMRASAEARQAALQEAAMARAEDLRKRSLDREDFVFEQDYRTRNPGQTAMQRNLEYYQSLDDAGKAAYQEMNPVYRQGPDGQFYRVDTAQGPMPTFTEDDWNSAAPMGGTGGNAGGGF